MSACIRKGDVFVREHHVCSYSDSANSPGICTPAGCFLVWRHRECRHTVRAAGLGLARASEKEIFNTEPLSASHSCHLAPHTGELSLLTAAYMSSSEAPQFCGRKRHYSTTPQLSWGFKWASYSGLKSLLTFMAPAHLDMLPLTLKVPLIRRLFELKAAFCRGWLNRACVCGDVCEFMCVSLMFVVMHRCLRCFAFVLLIYVLQICIHEHI